MSQFITQILLPISLAIIMLSIGLSVKWQDFMALKNYKIAIIGGFCLQVIALPLLALALIVLFAIPAEYAVALMIVACCPGGVTSNAITFIFSGVVALSVVLTLLSSLVAPLTIPLVSHWSLTHFMGDESAYTFSLVKTVMKLFVLSIVPIVVGNVIQYFAPTWCARYSERIRKLAGGWFLVLIGLMIFANYGVLMRVVSDLGWFMILLAVSSILLGFVGAWLLGLSSAYRLTLAIEVGVQNAGMGLIITGTVLHNQTMTMILIAYGILMQVPILLFAGLYRAKQSPQSYQKKTI